MRWVMSRPGGGAHGERAIYDSPWVWLGQVDVELPDGQRIWHHVVRLRRAVAMLLLDEQDRVLLLWRHRFIPDRWGWELPGGLADAERIVFTGRDPHRVGEPTDRTESERLAWIPLASVPGLIAAGQIWTSGSLVGLLHFQAVMSSPGPA